MTPEVTTREATTADDKDFLRRLFFVVRGPEFRAAGLDGPALDALLGQQYQAMTTHYQAQFPDAVYTLLEIDGERIGYEVIRETHELHLIDIALMPDHRNLGIGTRRMKLLMERAQASGKPVLLHVEVFNPARFLYDRLGFQITDDQGMYQQMMWHPVS